LKAGKTQAPVSDRAETGIAEPDAPLHDLVFELGLWVRGLEVFCATERQVFPLRTGPEHAGRNYRVEFQITHAVFIKCSELIAAIHRSSQADAFTQHAITELSEAVSSLVTLNNSIRQNATLSFVEWNAWCKMVAERLAKTSVFATFDSDLAANGRRYLPEKLERMIEDGTLSLADRTDLKRYLPRFGGILRVLDVVKEMLDRDEPLRPALVVFAFLHEAIDELTFDINNRLLRSPDENAEMFVLLDAASYSLSMESKKAFSQELAGISGIRSAITVFARVEAAHGVLNDNLQMLLTGFLRLTESGAPDVDVFPESLKNWKGPCSFASNFGRYSVRSAWQKRSLQTKRLEGYKRNSIHFFKRRSAIFSTKIAKRSNGFARRYRSQRQVPMPGRCYTDFLPIQKRFSIKLECVPCCKIIHSSLSNRFNVIAV
jgi:hypothetical protein